MQYRGISYSIAEIPDKPGKWRWTVKLSAKLDRTGISSDRSKAEAAAVKAINRTMAIMNELTLRASRIGDSPEP